MFHAADDLPKIDSLVRSSRRTISLHVTPDGKLEVRAPHLVPVPVIERFVRQKREWIEQTKHLLSLRSPLPSRTFAEGERFPLCGREYALHLTDGNTVTTMGTHLFFPRRRLPEARTLLREWYVSQARRIVTQRVREYAPKVGVQYKTISIRDVRTRWGSCSTSGTISFSWRLVMAPLPIIDYVVVHELSHVIHHDHSHAFWDTVFRQYPDYRSARTWLKRNGHTLEI